ncbi:MAG: hypothetical protein QXS41_01800 [Candidatus Woesearchaeota archaeon]
MKLSKFLIILILFFSVYSEKVILFNLEKCIVEDVVENVVTETSDVIPHYYVKYQNENLTYVIGKNSLDYIYLPLVDKFKVEVYDDENVYCNQSFNVLIKYEKISEDVLKRYVDAIEKYEENEKINKMEEYSLATIIPIFLIFLVIFIVLLFYRKMYRKLKKKK